MWGRSKKEDFIKVGKVSLLRSDIRHVKRSLYACSFTVSFWSSTHLLTFTYETEKDVDKDFTYIIYNTMLDK